MKKEQRDKLNGIRYFKVLKDCYDSEAEFPYKKGDIIRIDNNKIGEFIFYTSTDTNGLRNSLWQEEINFKPSIYPENKPFNLTEYLKEQPKISLTTPIEICAYLDSDHYQYFTPEFIDRIFNDTSNTVPMLNGETTTVSDYNRCFLGSNNATLEIVEKKCFGKCIGVNFNDFSLQDSQIYENKKTSPMIRNGLIPGIYTCSSSDSHINIPFFLPKGTVIDLSRPEYALLALNQSFLHVLANCTEITNLKAKKRILDGQNQDFLSDFLSNYDNESTRSKKIRYYEINDDIKISSLAQLTPFVYEEQGIDFLDNYERRRVPLWEGWNISVVKTREDGSHAVIKVDFSDYLHIIDSIDKELRKISRRLSKEEAFHIHFQEVTEEEKKRKSVQESKYVKNKAARKFRQQLQHGRIELVSVLNAISTKKVEGVEER